MRGPTTALMIVVGVIATPATALPQPPANATVNEVHSVRSRDRVLAALIARATEQSPTFRRLMDSTDASGLVYIEAGVCRYGVRACLVKVTSAGGRRFIFIKIYVRRTDRELMAAIGHELQHAVEVLDDPEVRDLPSLYFFYKRFQLVGTSMAFETKAATETGDAVGDEIRRFERVKAKEPSYMALTLYGVDQSSPVWRLTTREGEPNAAMHHHAAV